MTASQMLAHWSSETLANYMDNELREQVHQELAPCSDEEFLTRYLELHQTKYGQEFRIN